MIIVTGDTNAKVNYTKEFDNKARMGPRSDNREIKSFVNYVI